MQAGYKIAIKNDWYPLLKLAVPLAFIGVAESAVFFFETLFLAHLNEETLSAGALVSWLFGTLGAIVWGALTAISVLISHKHGAGDQVGISRVLRDGLLLALLFTIPTFLLFWHMSPIFLLFGQQPQMVLLASEYLHALAWGLLPNFVMIALLEFVVGMGRVQEIMIFSVLSVLLSIFFSYVLIFGKFGFPVLSIAGAGWGITIGYWITVVILAVYLLRDEHYKKYFQIVFHHIKPSFLWELFQVGMPIGIMYCIEVAFFFALTLMMGSMSTQLLAANQIALQYMGSLMAVIFSIAQAITVRMGHLLGAEAANAARSTAYIGTFMAVVFMGIVAIFYWFFPSLLISVDFDIRDPKNIGVIRDVEKLLAICALFQIFEAMRIALFGALRALKDTQFALMTSAVGFWFIALPLGYLLATYFHFSGAGLWWGMVIGVACSVGLLWFRFRRKMECKL